MGYKLIGFALIGVLSCPFSAAWGRTYAEACDALKVALKYHDPQGSNYESISNYQAAKCNTVNWQPGTATSEFPEDINYFLSLTPDKVDEPGRAKENAQAELAQAQDIAQRFDACKRQSVKAQTDCQASISQFGQVYSNDYSTLSGRLASASNQSSVENACSAISGFEGRVTSAVNQGLQACESYKSQCPSFCEPIIQEYNRMNGPFDETTKGWIDTNIRVAGDACNRIGDVMTNAQTSAQNTVNNLRNQCQAARRSLNEEKQAKSQDSDNNQMLRQAGQALQALGQAMQQPQTTPMYPYPQTPIAPELATGYSTSQGELNPGVSKGANYKGGTPTPNDAGLLMNDESGAAGPYEKSRKSAMTAPASAGGAGPQASTRGAPDAQKNRRAAGGRAAIDSDILKGYYGGAGGPGGFRVGGGYPGAPVAGPGTAGGRPLPKVGAPGGAVDLSRFAPKWIVRRDVATATGPDGITGPHTDLFKKVRNRYEAVLASLD